MVYRGFKWTDQNEAMFDEFAQLKSYNSEWIEPNLSCALRAPRSWC
jgi:hypothetical protein